MAESVKKSISDELGQCLLFKNLTSQERELVLSKGVVKPLVAGTMLRQGVDPLAFLSVVLAGKVRVHYEDSKIFAGGKVEHSVGRFFGKLDQAILLGKLLSVECLETSVLVEFNKEATLQILNAYSTVKEQLSRVKSAIESRIQQKELDEKGIREERIEFAAPSEIAPRYDVSVKGLTIRFPDRTVCQIKDVSSSGIFVMGGIKFPQGEELEVTLECPPLDIHGLSLCIKVMRVASDGVGCTLVFKSESQKSQWEDALLQFKTQQIDESFEKYLSTLKQPIEATISKDDHSMRCLILKLGREGALLQCKKTPEEGIGLFSFSVESSTGGRTLFQNDIEYVKAVGSNELIRFLDLSFENQKTLQDVLQLQAMGGGKETFSQGLQEIAINLNHEVASFEQTESSKEHIDIQDQKQLNDLFVRELAYNMLVLYSCTKYTVGDVVDIVVRVLFTPKKRGLKNPNFEFKGRVVRVVDANAVTELVNPSPESLAILSDLVQSQQSSHMATALHAQKDDAVSHTQRRIIQFILLMILLGVCILWSMSQTEV